jgi:hypothetical protein
MDGVSYNLYPINLYKFNHQFNNNTIKLKFILDICRKKVKKIYQLKNYKLTGVINC